MGCRPSVVQAHAGHLGACVIFTTTLRHSCIGLSLLGSSVGPTSGFFESLTARSPSGIGLVKRRVGKAVFRELLDHGGGPFLRKFVIMRLAPVASSH
jgi:hypothetical protein